MRAAAALDAGHLVVFINALINAFRLVAHVVMTRGGPDNASSLLLYYIHQVGFAFWDTACAFARFEFRGRDTVFMLVLLQLMAMSDVLLVETYRAMIWLGVRDTIFAVGLPYFASAFGIFCCAIRTRAPWC